MVNEVINFFYYNIKGVAKPAVFKKDKNNSSGNNFTLIWEADSYTPIIEYNLLFRKRQVC